MSPMISTGVYLHVVWDPDNDPSFKSSPPGVNLETNLGAQVTWYV